MNSLSIFFRNTFDKNRHAAINIFTYGFSFLSSLIVTISSGLIVTYDGQQYLYSAKGLANGDFSNHYMLMRPPAYPLFISIVQKVSSGDFRFLIFCQSFLITASIAYLLTGIARRFSLSNKTVTILSILLLSQVMVLGYSSSVLQQPLFIFYTNLLTGFLLRYYDRITIIRCFLFSLILVLGTSISPTLNIISFSSICLLILIHLHRYYRNQQLRLDKFIITTIIALVVCLPATLFNVSWNNYVVELTAGAKDYNKIKGPGLGDIKNIPSYFINNPLEAMDKFTLAYVSQSGLVPSNGWQGVYNNYGSPLFENRSQSEANFYKIRKCGVIDSRPESPWEQYVQDYFTYDCAPITLPTVLFSMLITFSYITKFLWVANLPLIAFSVFQIRKTRLRSSAYELAILIIPSMLTAYFYIFLGGQADRYAIHAITPYLIFIFLTYILTIEHSTVGKNES